MSVIAKRILLRIGFRAALVRLPACMTCDGLGLKNDPSLAGINTPNELANVTLRILRRALAVRV